MKRYLRKTVLKNKQMLFSLFLIRKTSKRISVTFNTSIKTDCANHHFCLFDKIEEESNFDLFLFDEEINSQDSFRLLKWLESNSKVLSVTGNSSILDLSSVDSSVDSVISIRNRHLNFSNIAFLNPTSIVFNITDSFLNFANVSIIGLKIHQVSFFNVSNTLINVSNFDIVDSIIDSAPILNYTLSNGSLTNTFIKRCDFIGSNDASFITTFHSSLIYQNIVINKTQSIHSFLISESSLIFLFSITIQDSNAEEFIAISTSILKMKKHINSSIINSRGIFLIESQSKSKLKQIHFYKYLTSCFIYSESSSVLMSHLTIDSPSFDVFARIDHSNTTFYNCNFKQIQYNKYLFDINDGNFYLIKCQFANLSTETDFSIFHATNLNYLLMNETIFLRLSSQYSTAFCFAASNITELQIHNSKFDNIQTGIILAQNISLSLHNFTMNECSFRQRIADDPLGLFLLSNKNERNETLRIENCTFFSNYAACGVFMISNITATISNSLFHFNQGRRGSVFTSVSSNVSLINTSYLHNSCKNGDGGIAFISDSYIEVINSLFFSNIAKKGGCFVLYKSVIMKCNNVTSQKEIGTESTFIYAYENSSKIFLSQSNFGLSINNIINSSSLVQYESCKFQCDTKCTPFLSGSINSLLINNSSLKSKSASQVFYLPPPTTKPKNFDFEFDLPRPTRRPTSSSQLASNKLFVHKYIKPTQQKQRIMTYTPILDNNDKVSQTEVPKNYFKYQEETFNEKNSLNNEVQKNTKGNSFYQFNIILVPIIFVLIIYFFKCGGKRRLIIMINKVKRHDFVD